MIVKRGVAVCFLSLVMAAPMLRANDWVFTGAVPGKHRGPVTAIVHRGDTVLSAGEDGYLEIWNPNGGTAADRFQASPYGIVAMAGRPNRNEVCIVENDGLGLYRISAWNYRERRNIFTLQFRDPINHITYSTGGNFIIAARTGRTGLVLIDSGSGDVLQSPQSLTGNIALAVTGRSERNMAVYLSSGILSYWDLETGNQISEFQIPASLSSPVLFSNSRYLAGVNAEGLAVIHAASGEILGRDAAIPEGALLCPADDALLALVQKDGSAELHRYSIDRNGRLSIGGRVSLAVRGAESGGRYTAIGMYGSGYGSIALGTESGSVALSGSDGRTQILSTTEQTMITDADISGEIIAFLADNGTIGSIPLNYSQLTAGRLVRMEKNDSGHNRITAHPGGSSETGRFVFWHDRNQSKPVIRSAASGSPEAVLGEITMRSPISTAASFGGKVQFVDTTGNISVVTPSDTGKNGLFTFFSVGLMDAAFIDSERLIIGRSAVSGNAPFMIINVNTGETVPLPYPGQAGIMVHRGATGNIYAAVITSQSNEADGVRTSILRLNLANSASSARLVDYQGEDTQFSLAETPDGIAATIGGESAAIYSGGRVQKLEITNGFPLKLADGGQHLISLDRDGNIAWHDNRTGKLLAVFRLHPSRWTLHTEKGTVSGGVLVN
ncbi:MAG: WD40 repeat domain-containing protein [Treponema sp.]|nr:WD40 repeat domain-containing protein [Treponema sp.]